MDSNTTRPQEDTSQQTTLQANDETEGKYCFINPFPHTTDIQKTTLEYMVAKGEIGRFEQFLLLTWLSESSALEASECLYIWQMVKSLIAVTDIGMPNSTELAYGSVPSGQALNCWLSNFSF